MPKFPPLFAGLLPKLAPVDAARFILLCHVNVCMEDQVAPLQMLSSKLKPSKMAEVAPPQWNDLLSPWVYMPSWWAFSTTWIGPRQKSICPWTLPWNLQTKHWLTLPSGGLKCSLFLLPENIQFPGSVTWFFFSASLKTEDKPNYPMGQLMWTRAFNVFPIVKQDKKILNMILNSIC